MKIFIRLRGLKLLRLSLMIASGLWFLCSQPAYAAEVQNGHLLSASNSPSSALVVGLPQVDVDQLESSLLTNYLTNHLGFLASQPIDDAEIAAHIGIEPLQAAMATNPGSAEDWNDLGRALFASQQYAGALMAYDYALLINPDYSPAWANRCGVLSQLKEYTQALLSCALALKSDDEHRRSQGLALVWNSRERELLNLEEY
ncbi:MAG: hypothetical protein AAGC93_22295 [Cyanobacteria bacterium P01_F01_bin.53]